MSFCVTLTHLRVTDNDYRSIKMTQCGNIGTGNFAFAFGKKNRFPF